MDITLVTSALPWIIGLAAIFFVGKLVQVVTMTTNYAKMVNKLPGPSTIPIFGNTWSLMVPHEEMIGALVKLLKPFNKEPIVRIWLGFFNARFVIMKAQAAEQILSSTVHIAKGDEYRYLQPWLGFGLLTSTGDKWHRHRKMLTPSFHFQILEDFLHVFTEQSQILVDILHQKVGKGSFDVVPYITHCALDIICESTMGTHHNAQRSSHSEYVNAVYKMGQRVEHRSTHPWLSIDFIYNLLGHNKQDRHYLNILHSFSKKVIAERQRVIKNNANIPETEEVFGKKRRLAFLDLLLEATHDGKGLTDEELREEVDTFMFEGHDTTSAAVAWAIFFLGHNPSIQQRVQEELDDVLGDANEPITTAKLSQLKYLEAVIKESIRIFPSVPIIARKLKENTIICGKTIPANSNVFIAPLILHHDPDVFPDSETFDPERFFGEKMKEKNPFAYIPFSAGPRNCIGQKFAVMEEKVMLSEILRNFTIKSHEKQEDIKLLIDPILHPSNGIIISLEKRV